MKKRTTINDAPNVAVIGAGQTHIFVSWLHPFKEQKLVVVGDRKMAVFDDTAPWSNKLLLYDHDIRWENNVPVPAKAEPERLEIPGQEPLKIENLKVLRVLNAGQRSLDENGNWIDIQTSPKGQSHESIPVSPSYDVHPTAVVDSDVLIGDGTKIWHFSHILSGSVIGKAGNRAALVSLR